MIGEFCGPAETRTIHPLLFPGPFFRTALNHLPSVSVAVRFPLVHSIGGFFMETIIALAALALVFGGFLHSLRLPKRSKPPPRKSKRQENEILQQRMIAEVQHLRAIRKQQEWEEQRPQREAEERLLRRQSIIDDYNRIAREAQTIQDTDLQQQILGEAEIRLRAKLKDLL